MSLVLNPITDEFDEVGSDELSELVNDPDMIDQLTIPLDNNSYLTSDNSLRYIKILNKHPTIKPMTIPSSRSLQPPVNSILDTNYSIDSGSILPEISKNNPPEYTLYTFNTYDEDIQSLSAPSPRYSMTDLPSITIRDDNLLEPYTVTN